MYVCIYIYIHTYTVFVCIYIYIYIYTAQGSSQSPGQKETTTPRIPFLDALELLPTSHRLEAGDLRARRPRPGVSPGLFPGRLRLPEGPVHRTPQEARSHLHRRAGPLPARAGGPSNSRSRVPEVVKLRRLVVLTTRRNAPEEEPRREKEGRSLPQNGSMGDRSARREGDR